MWLVFLPVLWICSLYCSCYIIGLRFCCGLCIVGLSISIVESSASSFLCVFGSSLTFVTISSFEPNSQTHRGPSVQISSHPEWKHLYQWSILKLITLLACCTTSSIHCNQNTNFSTQQWIMSYLQIRLTWCNRLPVLIVYLSLLYWTYLCPALIVRFPFSSLPQRLPVFRGSALQSFCFCHKVSPPLLCCLSCGEQQSLFKYIDWIQWNEHLVRW